jgi:hypothetical protein
MGSKINEFLDLTYEEVADHVGTVPIYYNAQAIVRATGLAKSAVSYHIHSRHLVPDAWLRIGYPLFLRSTVEKWATSRGLRFTP